MAKPNYQFQKRQRDLAKKKKKEEKRLLKLARKNPPVEDAEETPGNDQDVSSNPEKSSNPKGASASENSVDS